MLLRHLLLSAALVLMPGSLVWAGSDALTLVAMVLPRVSVDVVSAPVALDVTPADVERGWVEVEQPMDIAVRSNLPHGVQLAFVSANRQLAVQSVSGAGVTGLQLSGAVIVLPYARDPQQLTVRLRFQLAAGARPGVYAWPVQVAAAS